MTVRRRRWRTPNTAEEWAALGAIASAVATFCGFLAVVFTVPIAYGQWRSDHVMQLEQQWSSPEMLKRRNRLIDALIYKHAQPLSDGTGELVTFDPADKRQMIDLISPTEDYVGLDGDLTAYLDFFNTVAICIDTKNCKKSEACEYFKGHAEGFQVTFGAFLEQRRKIFGDKDYGREFEKLTTICDGGTPPEHFPELSANLSDAERHDLDEQLTRKGAFYRLWQQSGKRMKPPLDSTSAVDVTVN